MTEQTTSPDSKKALLDAFDQVLKTQAEAREAERLAAARRSEFRPSAITWVAVLVLLVTSAYLWLERPQWIFPPPPLPESVAVKEASLRIGLANAARHVEHFRRKTGRLPSTLQEAGTLASGIVYETNGPVAYVLRGANGPVRLSLRSTDSLPLFVGNSFELITRRTSR